MMTSASSSLGKSPAAPPTTTYTASSSQSAAQSSFDTNRRPSNAGLPIPGAPRKGQASRKQHRPQRRPGMPPAPQSRPLDQDDAMAELRALRNPSSRRGQTSITHLLNYALPPRQVYTQGHGYGGPSSSSSRSYRRNPTWSHPADKARYVHANYRFVVSPAGHYALQATDPDEHLDWADVLQVLASAESQQTACPICLGEPVAPRMAKCGHIFCLPCLIRFMNSHGGDGDGPGHGHGGGQEKRQNRWRKCPICDDTVYMLDARPVRFYAGQESPLPRPGDDVVLRLMARNAKSTLALPREGGGAAVLGPGDDVPWHFAVNVLDYARIMKGTGAYMEEQYDREIEDLLRQEKEDELLFHQDNEWTQRAIRAVTASKEKVKGLGELALAGSTPVAAPAATPSASSSSQPRPAAAASDHDFYFYTAPPHLYLSPLDIRILKTHFGAFAALPSTLLPRVEHISTGHAVDDAVRKRAKYLGHLPQGCLVGFLECDWTDIVPAETLQAFADEVERRRRRNRDKAAQEERERLLAERAEAAALRDSRRGVVRLSREAEEDALALKFGGGGGGGGGEAERVDLEHDFAPLGGGSTPPPNPRNGFARLADVSTSPSAARTVWGTPAVAGEGPEADQRIGPPRNVDDGWLKDDEVLQTLGEVDLALQMEALGVVDDGQAQSAGPSGGASTPGGAGAGKKKKKQKITLMSTGGRRGT